jgi:hypothetical protein
VTWPTPHTLVRWLLALLLLVQGGAVTGVPLGGAPQEDWVAGYDERADLPRASRVAEAGRYIETGSGEEKRDAAVLGAAAVLPVVARLLLAPSRDPAPAPGRNRAERDLPGSFQPRAPPALA